MGYLSYKSALIKLFPRNRVHKSDLPPSYRQI